MLRKLLINTSSNMLVLIVKISITFIMTPIFVHSLGNYDYGLWEMLGAVTGYMGMLDLGIKPAISRFAAKYEAEQDKASLASVYGTTFGFMALMGLLLFAVFAVWGLFFPHSLAEPGADASRYGLVLLIVGAQLLFSFPGYVPESFLEGFQLYHLKNNITIFNSILGSVLMYQYITPENALVLLAAINAGGISLKYLVYFWIVKQPAFGGLTPQLRDFSWSRLREMVTFGGKSFIQGVAYRLESATDTLVIGFFLGPAMVPFYSIPAALLNYIRGIGFTLTHAFMPMFSRMQVLSDQSEIANVYVMASKWVVGLILPMAVGATLVGSAFLGVWIGPQYRENADIIILLLVIFTVVPFLDPFKSRYLTAIGEHGFLARWFPVAALLNFLLSIALVKPLGIVGVALGSVLPVFIFTPFYLRFVCKHLGISLWFYFSQAIAPLLIPCVLMGLTVVAYKQVWALSGYLPLSGAVGAGALVYALGFWLVSLNRGERGFILQRLGFTQSSEQK